MNGTTRLAGLLRARLYQARWLLGVAVAGTLVLAWSAAASPLLAGLVVVAILLAAAFGPRRSARGDAGRPPQAAGNDVGGLSAVDLAASVSDPIILFDRTGAVLHANPAAHAAFAELPDGLRLQARFRAAEMQELVRDVLAGKAVEPIEYAERVPVERAYQVAAMPIGRGIFVMVLKDQSEARRIDRMRADFIANASHELRTPLASISGFIETLRGAARDDERARENFLQIMQSQTGRMARLIDDLLSLSRLETRTYVRPTRPVDIRSLLAQVVEAHGHLARELGVTIESELPEGAVEVPGNRDELYQVFQNLIENACRYGASGGRVVVRLEDRRKSAEPEVVVTVQDFGPGIAPEHIPRITERFYRVDGEASRGHKGTGLGLAIVKHILTRHNGRLAIRSEPGKGSTFAVHLAPFAQREGERA